VVILFSFTGPLVNSEPWSVSLVHTCSFWLQWLFFFPPIVWLSLRFPLERPNIFLQAGFHLVACALVVIVSQVAYRTFLPLPPPPQDMAPAPQNFPRPVISIGFRMGPDIVIYLLTMSSCVAFAHFRKSQEKERRSIELETHLAQAKLQALRMQINPHFLFNTLNAISTLVHTSPHTADEMISDLSELFRASLESSGDQEIPSPANWICLSAIWPSSNGVLANGCRWNKTLTRKFTMRLCPRSSSSRSWKMRSGTASNRRPASVAIRCRRNATR
jgi:hypothetical protein